MGADTVVRTGWLGDTLASPQPRAQQAPPLRSVAADPEQAFDPLSISHARSLRGLPLDLLGAATGREGPPVHLNAAETRNLLAALRASAHAASTRLADSARAYLRRRPGGWSPDRPEDVAAALHRILTRSRFLKGSRSCFPLETATAQIMPFVEACQPVTIMASGFPFKQHDNGLKSAGPWPDLAELGALLRFTELQQAFAALYPPGLRLVVLNDGGYLRPRASAEMLRYRRQLQRYARLVGLGDTVVFVDQGRFVAGLLGRDGWEQRERCRYTFRELIGLVAAGSKSLQHAVRADQCLAEVLPPGLLNRVPSFRDILGSLVYSVPVPVPLEVNPRRWACAVLARPDEYRDPDLLPELASARRQVLASAWADTVNYLAASLADVASGVARRFPPHVRLATVASRKGCSGFSYLGGSALLPWHGTGCLDGRGLLCAEFLVSLQYRGFSPVYSDYLSPEQPALMVPFARTMLLSGRRRVDSDLLAAARLRTR